MTQAQKTAATKAVKKNTAKRAAQPTKIQTRRDRVEVAKPSDTKRVTPVDASTWKPVDPVWAAKQAQDIEDMRLDRKARLAREPRYTKAQMILVGVSVAAGFLLVWVIALLVR